MAITCAGSLGHEQQPACNFSTSRTDVSNLASNIQMNMIASSFVVIVIGLCTHPEHMIEQVHSLDELGMPNFMRYFLSQNKFSKVKSVFSIFEPIFISKNIGMIF